MKPPADQLPRRFPQTFRLVVGVFALQLAACDHLQDLGSLADASADGSVEQGLANADATTVRPPFSPLPARAVCERLLQCADTQNPSQFGDFFPIYGTNGTCWQSETEAACRTGCVDALRQFYESMSYHPCNYCDTENSCPSYGVQPQVCHPQTHHCVECVVDADCPHSGNRALDRPYCSPTTNGCHECLDDSHCGSSAECAYRSGTCKQTPTGRRCDFVYSGTFTVTVSGSGFQAWEGKRAWIRADTEPSKCGPGYYTFQEIKAGAFSAELLGQVGPALTVRIFLDTDGTGPRAERKLANLAASKDLSLAFTPADFSK
ncbi:MAG: hypothetical protein H6707_06910 [Deltaproteobacteria bacterium]|nr:hypothetical protein [Deltaproteobacteria bacterium]